VKRLASRDLWTTLAEVAGALFIIAGAAVLFGLGVALAVTGVLLIAFGYLASGGAA
jgi:hypothetical protein